MDIRAEFQDAIQKAARRAREAADDKLEDILAGLMVAGVRPDEIELREFRATGAREVAVRGEVKYRIEGPIRQL